MKKDKSHAVGQSAGITCSTPVVDVDAERKPIKVYTIWLQGKRELMRGPTEKTIKGILDCVETELAQNADYDDPRTIKITTAEMFEDEYDVLPEFAGY